MAVLSPIGEVSTHPSLHALGGVEGALGATLGVVGVLGIEVDVCLWGDVDLFALTNLPPETL